MTTYLGVALDSVLPLARGRYQRRLLSGRAEWSGSDLRGRARHWSSGYWRSRVGLCQRIEAAGYLVDVRLVERRVTVVIHDGTVTLPGADGARTALGCALHQ